MKHLLTFIVLLLAGGMHAQFLSPMQLDTAHTFRSMAEALKNPEDVFVLRLKVKKGEIPPQLFDLPYLHVLELKKGKIAQLPNDFTRLKHLVKLDLTGNQLSHFPKVLYEMTQLEALHLGKNPISRVPEEITRMTGLKVLDLWSTQVDRLPVVIGEMESLREVDLRMIEISLEEQEYLIELMPHVHFNFSVPCNCR
jgi:Leucine-rich repeat (LRR) protein